MTWLCRHPGVLGLQATPARCSAAVPAAVSSASSGQALGALAPTSEGGPPARQPARCRRYKDVARREIAAPTTRRFATVSRRVRRQRAQKKELHIQPLGLPRSPPGTTDK